MSCAHLSRNVLLVTQAGGVGILSSHAVHGVVYLRSGPAVHLERCGYPLERVSLDPAAKNNKTSRGNTYSLHNLLRTSQLAPLISTLDLSSYMTKVVAKGPDMFLVIILSLLIVFFKTLNWRGLDCKTEGFHLVEER